MYWLIKLLLELVFAVIKLAASDSSAPLYPKRQSAHEHLERLRKVDDDELHDTDAEKKERARRVLEEAKKTRARRVLGTDSGVDQVDGAAAEAARLVGSDSVGAESALPDASAEALQARTASHECPECRAYNPPDSAFCGECGGTIGIPAA
jgi:hypothetical protein